MFHSGFPIGSPHAFIFSQPCLAYLILLDLITRIMFGDGCRSLSSSLCSFLHSPVISPLLGPNILSTLFSNTFSPRSALRVSDQVSHPYKTTGKIIVLYIIIFKFLVANWKIKDSAPNDSKRSLTLFCSQFLPE